MRSGHFGCASSFPPAGKQEAKPAGGRSIPAAQIMWTWAKLTGTYPPDTVTFPEMWRSLVRDFGDEKVEEAAATYDRETYAKHGWEAAF